MATQKKYKYPKYISSGKSTFLALTTPTYARKKNKRDELDIEIRTLKNYFRDKKRDKEQEGINATWKDVNPVKRSPTIRTKLNEKSNGGRKRNSTKKKRHNKTKKKTTTK